MDILAALRAQTKFNKRKTVPKTSYSECHGPVQPR